MNTNPLDQPGTPFEMELINPNPSARRTKNGPQYWVRFEVTKEVHDAFMESGQNNLRLAARMVVMPDTDEEEAQRALETGQKIKLVNKKTTPYGSFWTVLRIRKGFFTHPDCRSWLEASTPDDAWNRMHTEFDVESLSVVSPDQLRERLNIVGLGGLILLMNQAEVIWKEERERKAA